MILTKKEINDICKKENIRCDENDEYQLHAFKNYSKKEIRAYAKKQLERSYSKEKAEEQLKTELQNDPKYFYEEWLESMNETNYSNGCLRFYVGSSTFSCGVPEFGDFSFNKKLNQYWEVLLSFFIRNSEDPYFRCSTLTNKEYKPVNRALANLGFTQQAKLKSNHSKNYKIIVWEYVR